MLNDNNQKIRVFPIAGMFNPFNPVAVGMFIWHLYPISMIVYDKFKTVPYELTKLYIKKLQPKD